ncbi:Enoyl-CoA hydratase [Rhodococcus wratislaviensis]|uniref:Enoyl-CoA hydratase n=1 Tax=Rhodococcus wratislaviensis TaxID=44752 RepID=A0A402CD92_RHOWR|nr:Enoyl-CoA hydratase [Rhodococcus wratislaviensis]
MTGDDTTVLLTEQVDRVRLITFNRPEKRNAWSDELSVAYAAALADADRDPAVRVIVVAAAGSTFCVGGDMEDLKTFAAERTFARKNVRRSAPWETTRVRKPVVAAIQGACAGIGFAHALACDVRFAAMDARFTTTYARRGLPAESGVAWLLPRVIGMSAAVDLLLSARVIGAAEAMRLGLVAQVIEGDEVLSEALRYAHDLARSCSPKAMQTIKEQLWAGQETVSFELSAVSADQLAERFLTDSDDVMEGVSSFVEKRPPEFGSLPRPDPPAATKA